MLLFACIEKNIGDDLFIETLCARYPNIRFVISSDAKYGSLEQIPNLRFSHLLKLWLLFNDRSSSKTWKKIITWFCRNLLDFIIGDYRVAVYIVGNAFKNTDYIGYEQSSWFANRLKLAKHFYILSTNFGPYNDNRWFYDMHELFSLAEDICFRDKDSYLLFRDLKNVRYAPDAVLSSNRRGGLCDSDSKLLLMSVIDCAFGNRGPLLPSLAMDYEKKMIEIIRYFEKLEYEVVLINSNTIQDSPASKRIMNSFTDSPFVSLFNYDGNINTVEDLYKRASAVVATRLHAIILAWLYRVPVFPISYDQKIENLLDSYEYTGDFVRISDIDNLSLPRLLMALDRGIDDCFVNRISREAQLQFKALDKELNRIN